MLVNKAVKIVSVPRMDEFSAKHLYRNAAADQVIGMYLPNYSPGRPYNRQYLFNVSAHQPVVINGNQPILLFIAIIIVAPASGVSLASGRKQQHSLTSVCR